MQAALEAAAASASAAAQPSSAHTAAAGSSSSSAGGANNQQHEGSALRPVWGFFGGGKSRKQQDFTAAAGGAAATPSHNTRQQPGFAKLGGPVVVVFVTQQQPEALDSGVLQQLPVQLRLDLPAAEAREELLMSWLMDREAAVNVQDVEWLARCVYVCVCGIDLSVCAGGLECLSVSLSLTHPAARRCCAAARAVVMLCCAVCCAGKPRVSAAGTSFSSASRQLCGLCRRYEEVAASPAAAQLD